MLQAPTGVIEQERSGLEQAWLRLDAAADRRLTAEKSTLTELSAMLTALSPAGTLSRGYAIVRLPDGTIVRDASEVAKGDLLETMVAKGTFVSQVVGTNRQGSFTEQNPSPR